MIQGVKASFTIRTPNKNFRPPVKFQALVESELMFDERSYVKSGNSESKNIMAMLTGIANNSRVTFEAVATLGKQVSSLANLEGGKQEDS